MAEVKANINLTTSGMTSHVLTVDLEDWFHGIDECQNNWTGYQTRIKKETKWFLNLLDKFDVKATFFVLGDVARNHPDLISEIGYRGHEIGTHGMEHKHVWQQTPREFCRDLRDSIRLLNSLNGSEVISYRAPYFSITSDTLWALDILKSEGIRYDSSIFPAYNPRYGIANAKRVPHEILPQFWECPVSTIPSLFGNFPMSGGAYFRILPWWFIRYCLKVIENRMEPIILYFHPYDFDVSQPVCQIRPWLFTARRYYGIRSTGKKLKKLLRRYRFTTLSSFMSRYSSPMPIDAQQYR